MTSAELALRVFQHSLNAVNTAGTISILLFSGDAAVT
jgi:hypothetical protein